MESISNDCETITKKRYKKYNKHSTRTRYCQYHKTSKIHYIVDDDVNKIVFITSREDYDKNLSICKMSCKSKSSKDKLPVLKHNLSEDILYTPKLKKSKEKSLNNDNCPICLDSLIGKNVKRLGCSHEMCLGCFDNYQTLREEDVYQNLEIPELEIEFLVPIIDVDMFIKYNIDKKMINYTVKCPMCRKSVYNNNDSINN